MSAGLAMVRPLLPAARPAGGSVDVDREALREIAFRIERLSPSPRNPSRFHEDKSEIVAELNHLAEGR